MPPSRFAQALEAHPPVRRLGDVQLHYEDSRFTGVSQPPPWSHRLWPGISLALGLGFTLLCAFFLARAPGLLPMSVWIPGLLALACVSLALWLEGRLGRRRFVLHFRSEQLRLETLRWSPSRKDSHQIPFDDVRAVECMKEPSGECALQVRFREGDREATHLLIARIPPAEHEELLRVWRLLQHAFGLKESEPAEN